MAPYHNFDDSDDDSDDEHITLVSTHVPGPQAEEQYPCQQCPEHKRPVFESHAALVKHKIQAEHQYCKKCDQEFGSRDDLEMHILRSNRHITCFMCVKEFRSESGLQLHTQQIHRTTAGGMCPRCHENFATQAGLLQHIEGNLCPGGLRRGEIYSAIKDHQHRTNEELRNRSETGTEASSEKPMTTREEDQASELVNSFSHFKIYDQRAGTKPEEEIIKVDMAWWDPERRHYNCPYRTCGKKFKNSDAFQQHLNSDAHAAKNFSCPGCKKRFPSSSAMLQHVESGMCRISKMADYDRVKSGLTIPVDQSRLTKSLATFSHRSETLSTVGAPSDARRGDLSTVGAKTKPSEALSTVGTKPAVGHGNLSEKLSTVGARSDRGGKTKKPPSSTASRSEALSTVGTNQNQYAEQRLQQMKQAWGGPARENEGGDPAHASGSKPKGKGKGKASPSKASEAVKKRAVAENRKPDALIEYSFGKDSDSEEEGTLSTVG
ncbi:hypothetical protein TWF281_009255 [Arthrobotrys megalospora]